MPKFTLKGSEELDARIAADLARIAAALNESPHAPHYRALVLLANPGLEPASGALAVPRAGQASVWNPETGAVEERGAVERDSLVEVDIPAQSARFVVVAGAA